VNIFPFVRTVPKIYGITCDSCGKPLATTLIAVSDRTKMRLCSSCTKALVREMAVDAEIAKTEEKKK